MASFRLMPQWAYTAEASTFTRFEVRVLISAFFQELLA